MLVQRILDLSDLLKRKSFFLFGPRGTGKSFLIRHQLGNAALTLDLLESDLSLRLNASPGDLEGIVDGAKGTKKWIVIDEVQKVPALLDEVHRLIEKRGFRFLLTGSSARKLKRGHANLLAGRAWTAELYPFTWKETPNIRLDRRLKFGGLPAVLLSDEPQEELKAYVRTYLYEEIQAEGLVRGLPAFSRFLKTAALSHGQLLNFQNVSSDAGVPPATVREHYRILEDTLLGFMLEPWKESKKRKAIATAKFYFFDTGVLHAINGITEIDRHSDLYGRSFETFIGSEIRAYLSYRRREDGMTFWRSKSGHEVDFLVGDHTAIEVKATAKVRARDPRGLIALQEEGRFKNLILVSQDPILRKTDGIRFLDWKTFLEELWGDLY